MNKKFIIKMMSTLKKEQTQPQVYKKIKIHEELKQPITYEEIQNEKKSKFEMELNERQIDFTNALSRPVPPTPNFKDNYNYDAPPISELDKEIKKLQEQRKYDLDNIRHPNPENNNEWLKTLETNIKKEKLFNEKHVTWSETAETFTEPEKDESFTEQEPNSFNDIDFFKKLKSKNNLHTIKDEITFIKTRLNELEQNIIQYIQQQ